MPIQEQRIPVNIEEEMKRSYLDYAMSVIIGRALPDVRDGLKPVHRRVLYAMDELGLTHRSPYKKSARVVGECLGKYHPHGDQAVYDTIVRMVQDFSMRYPLVDGQGNFGCFTGDTKILLVDGTTKTFAELASLGSEARFYVYSVNCQGRIVIGEGRNARVTRRNAELVEVLLDNGKRIRCTPDHLFMLRDGTYKQAKDLTSEDSLMAGYFDEAPVRGGTNTYLRVRQPDGDWTFVHWLADEFNLARGRYTRSAGRIRHQHARTYNHRVVSVRWLQEREDVYDMTVDEHHNFLLAAGVFVHNSVDGDAPAAMRYTEVRLAKIAQEMLRDIDKETVDFAPNFDGSLEEPRLLPAALPNLLVNGASGIAVGMATNIPSHNLGEVVDALLMQLEDPDISLEQLLEALPGPDFPTAGFIHGKNGIAEAYKTGRGLLTLRAKAFVEKARGGKEAIVVTELPYQVNKAKLIERIAELVRDRKIEGVANLRDESDREGMRIVIELKKDEAPRPILNQLYKHTPMQSTFGVIMLALVGNQPKVLTLKELLQHFLDHRKEIIVRRTRYDLKKAEEKAHILEGYRIALDHLDQVIALIRGSRSAEEAKAGLVQRFNFSEIQAQAILDLRLQRLTQLERQKIQDEYRETIENIERFQAILRSEALVRGIIKEELLALKEAYADPRRTEIVEESTEIEVEDMLADEEMVITVTHGGYIKRTPLDTYRSQRRGGKGMTGIVTKEEDYVEHLFVATTLSYILLFTNLGKVHWLKVHEIPQLGRVAKGKALVNFLHLEPGEKITTMIPIRQFEVDKYLLMATKQGTVKKTELSAFSNLRSGGIIAISLDEGDELIAVRLTSGQDEVFLGTKDGMAIRFKEEEVRPMGRAAHGVIAISLEEGDEVVGMEVVSEGAAILTVTGKGYGKRTPLDQYRLQGRGGRGIINLKVTERTGSVAGLMQVRSEDGFMTISQEGKIARLRVSEVSVFGRATQGVRLQGLNTGDRVAAITRVVSEEEEEEAA